MHWMYKMLAKPNSVERVFKVKSILSSTFMQNMGLWVFGLPILRLIIVRIFALYFIAVIKSQI